MDFAGAPLPAEVLTKIATASASADDRDTVRVIQDTLDPLCVAFVNINAESRVKVTEGPARKELMQAGLASLSGEGP